MSHRANNEKEKEKQKNGETKVKKNVKRLKKWDTKRGKAESRNICKNTGGACDLIKIDRKKEMKWRAMFTVKCALK